MRYHKESGSDCGNHSGVTLLELVIVVGIFAIILGFVGTAGLRFYRQVTITSERDTVRTILRRARSNAMANTNSSDFGVFFKAESSILFEGSSYAARNAAADVLYDRPMGITVAGPEEIVFSAIRGNSSASGTITIANGFTTRTVIVNHEGRIDW